MTPLSGDTIDNVVSRFDDCVGVWADGYYDDINSNWYDSKQKHCYDDNNKFDGCRKYTRYYSILNPDYTGVSCEYDDGDTIQEYCDNDMTKSQCE